MPLTIHKFNNLLFFSLSFTHLKHTLCQLPVTTSTLRIIA
jgi:hypothetical protein